MKWQPIETAPTDKKILIWNGKDCHCAQWVKNPYTDEVAWCIAELGGGDRVITKAIYWMPLPDAPEEIG